MHLTADLFIWKLDDGWQYIKKCLKMNLCSCATALVLVCSCELTSLVIFFNMFKIVYKNMVFSTFYWDLKARIIILGFSSPIPVDIQKIQKTSKIDVRDCPFNSLLCIITTLLYIISSYFI